MARVDAEHNVARCQRRVQELQEFQGVQVTLRRQTPLPNAEQEWGNPETPVNRERRTVNGERRTVNGERRTVNGERRTVNGER